MDTTRRGFLKGMGMVAGVICIPAVGKATIRRGNATEAEFLEEEMVKVLGVRGFNVSITDVKTKEVLWKGIAPKDDDLMIQIQGQRLVTVSVSSKDGFAFQHFDIAAPSTVNIPYHSTAKIGTLDKDGCGVLYDED